jgi:hypothetical protein
MVSYTLQKLVTSRHYIYYRCFVTPCRSLLQVCITFITNALLLVRYIHYKCFVTPCRKSLLHSLQMVSYTLQNVCYHCITFITNPLLPDHYKSLLHSLQKFVTTSLHPLQTCCYQTITFITNILLHLTEVCYIHYKRVVTGPLQVAFTFITKVCYIHYKLVVISPLQVTITSITY